MYQLRIDGMPGATYRRSTSGKIIVTRRNSHNSAVRELRRGTLKGAE